VNTYFNEEEFDPRGWEPEPDLSDLQRPVEWERSNACVYYALEEFYKNMAEYEDNVLKRRFTQEERRKHLGRFQAMLQREYGRSTPASDWVEKHESWLRSKGIQP
jgi:hypothetical protein